jgi:hypothetical protein
MALGLTPAVHVPGSAQPVRLCGGGSRAGERVLAIANFAAESVSEARAL